MKLPIHQLMLATGVDKQFKAVRGTIWAAFFFSAFLYGSCLAGNLFSSKCPVFSDAKACEGERQGMSMAFAACIAGVLGLNTRNPKLRSGIGDEEFLEIDDDLITGPIRHIEEEISGFRQELAHGGEIAREVVQKTADEIRQDAIEVIPALGGDVVDVLTEKQQLDIYRKVWRERHHFD